MVHFCHQLMHFLRLPQTSCLNYTLIFVFSEIIMSKAIPLFAGETAINHAPYIALDNNTQCIPQHYLRYQHDLASVEALIQEIEFHPQYPIFVCQDETGLYLQIGIIGYDNYQARTEQSSYKIVYGRKWRIESQLPSSEIIQTAFLAIKKAREHEIRELFTLSLNAKTCTPFNNHHDLPLLSRASHQIEQKNTSKLDRASIEALLSRIEYDKGRFSLIKIEERKNAPIGEQSVSSCLIELIYQPSKQTHLEELAHQPITLILQYADTHYFMFALMQHLIQLSDRQVDESFKFKGVKRFSWHNDIEQIGQVSIQTRDKQIANNNQHLANALAQNNYQTDKTRVPQIMDSLFGSDLKKKLSHFQDLQGILPINLFYHTSK